MQVCCIGAGVMARAIASGAKDHSPDDWSFVFFDVYEPAAREAALAVQGEAAQTVAGAVEGADIVLLAVKPQVQSAVLRDLPPLGGTTVVSIAAGRSLADIERDMEGTNPGISLVRVMPNLNAQVGYAASALCHNSAADEAQVRGVAALFESVGTVQFIPEHLFSAFTAMAGSSPAWFFQIVDDLARAGVKFGLTKAQAVEAACSSMLGSAVMLQKVLGEGGNAAQLVDRVCSPGGTTIAGLLAAQEAGMGPALVAAVDATIARDRELGAGN